MVENPFLPVNIECGIKEKRPAYLRVFFSGAKEIRTPDLLHAMQALYQLSYNPIRVRQILKIILKLSRGNAKKIDFFCNYELRIMRKHK